MVQQNGIKYQNPRKNMYIGLIHQNRANNSAWNDSDQQTFSIDEKYRKKHLCILRYIFGVIIR